MIGRDEFRDRRRSHAWRLEGERDFDGQPAVWARLGAQRGAMGGGDRVDDREAEPVPAGVVGAGSVKTLERLQQARHLLGGDRGAAVGDRQECVLVAGAGRDLDVSLGDVVADRVVEEVGDQALDESRIASRRCWGERRADVEVAVRGL